MSRSIGSQTFWKYLLGSLAWGGSVIGVLQVGRLPAGKYTHAVCGAWGCGPPAEALLAYHGFWLMLLLPPALVYGFNAEARWVRRLGRYLVFAGMVGLTGMMGWAAYDWLQTASLYQRSYVVQRVLFVVVTLVDVPIVQLILCGMGCWYIGVHRTSMLNAAEFKTRTDLLDHPAREDHDLAFDEQLVPSAESDVGQT